MITLIKSCCSAAAGCSGLPLDVDEMRRVALLLVPAVCFQRPPPSSSTRPRRELLRPISAAKAGFGAKAAAAKTKKKPAEPKSVGLAPVPSSARPPEKHELPAGCMFMGGWLIDPSICDDLVACFETSPSEQTRGMVSMKGGSSAVVNTDVKDSIEMNFAPNDKRPAWRRYVSALQGVMGAYMEEYPMAGAYGVFSLTSRTNFQYYPPSGGYKTYHTERTGAGEPEGSRHLVFMTYLNDVHDAGGTEFYHQKLTVNARKGLTLVWPADWTFTHRGVASPTEEKRIITGWFNFG